MPNGSKDTQNTQSSLQSHLREGIGEPYEFELTVLIPCLNEALTIASCVSVALDAMAIHGIAGEVLVSDNGSIDASVEIAIAAGARVVSCPIRGYGAALQWGFLHAKGRYVLMADADQSYDFSLIPRFVAHARTGAPFVIGTRLRGRIEKGAMPLLHRYLGTPVLTWILNTLFGTRISDCNCGMRCIERDTYLKLNLLSPGMEFASEMVVKAAIQGVAMTEIPIHFQKDRRDRRPHLRSFRDGWRHLRLLLSHAPDLLMTLPGLCMLAVGFPLILAQLAGPITLGRAHMDIHYMILGVTLSLVGTSAAALGLVTGSIMPRGRVRLLSWLDKLHRSVSFDNAATLAGALFLAGLLSDAFVLTYWLYHDQGELTIWFTRLTLFGLVLISMSTQIVFPALLLGTAAGSEHASGRTLVSSLSTENVTPARSVL